MAKSKAARRFEEARKADDLLREAQAIVQSLFDEVDEEFGNLSEKAQEGDKGQALEEQRSKLEDLLSEIETQADNVGNLFEEA